MNDIRYFVTPASFLHIYRGFNFSRCERSPWQCTSRYAGCCKLTAFSIEHIGLTNATVSLKITANSSRYFVLICYEYQSLETLTLSRVTVRRLQIVPQRLIEQTRCKKYYWEYVMLLRSNASAIVWNVSCGEKWIGHFAQLELMRIQTRRGVETLLLSPSLSLSRVDVFWPTTPEDELRNVNQPGIIPVVRKRGTVTERFSRFLQGQHSA